MRYAILASALALTVACSGLAVAETTMTRTTTTETVSPEQRTEFHQYVVRQNRPSVALDGFNVEVGAVLPPAVAFYDVPNMDTYRYTIVNQRRVLVDPTTRRIVEVDEDRR